MVVTQIIAAIQPIIIKSVIPAVAMALSETTTLLVEEYKHVHIITGAYGSQLQHLVAISKYNLIALKNVAK